MTSRNYMRLGFDYSGEILRWTLMRPHDLRAAVVRFAEAAAPARFELTYFDLNIALPQREYSAQEVEAMLNYLGERGIHLSEDS